MLSVVTWKWKPPHGYRSTFGPEAVNVLFRMVKRHYSEFRPICVTDDASGLDSSITVVRDWADFVTVPSPHGGRNPSCYRRLRMFHPDIAHTFGPRFVSLDLDTVVTGDLRPLWDRPEDIVLWGETNPQPGSHYNGSMMLLRAGARPQVWNTFDPKHSPKRALQAKAFGSDQGHLSFVLGPNEAKWGTKDGVYSYQVHIYRNGGLLPKDARITMWHGGQDPWGSQAQRLPWVRQYYQ